MGHFSQSKWVLVERLHWKIGQKIAKMITLQSTHMEDSNCFP